MSKTVTANYFATIVPALAQELDADHKRELAEYLISHLGDIAPDVDPLALRPASPAPQQLEQLMLQGRSDDARRSISKTTRARALQRPWIAGRSSRPGYASANPLVNTSRAFRYI
ncbi:hypothetical protein TRAPUB_9755 [Trametes pubescens]|uniref:Uncharacterized protein n=1 Tax=Trametes pubescens TaxID=154538 RepID=A0A1M2W1G8_TRAPU|nr:hypothetical protein TRAPUB_9755 [Trametes pubescens]